MSEDEDNKEALAEGTLMSHLLELRDRLMKGMLALLLTFIPCALYANELYSFIAQPLLAKLPAGTALIATGVVTPFMTPFKLAFYAAIFIAMPVLLYQIWAFIAPGLYKREKRFAVPLLVSSVVLFYGGVVFAYFVVFPVMFSYLVGTAPAGVSYMPDIAQYLDFILTMFFAFGVAFEVPVAVVLLVLTGLVKVDSLGKNRGYVIIGIFVVAAVLTPPDAISQTIMALPMWLLYEGGLVMARIMQKMRREAAEQASKDGDKKEEAEAS
jgi:sec-independent protein translocase protein TatC